MVILKDTININSLISAEVYPKVLFFLLLNRLFSNIFFFFLFIFLNYKTFFLLFAYFINAQVLKMLV